MKTTILFVVVLLGWIYFLSNITNDARFIDGTLEWTEMYYYEYPIYLTLFIGTFFLYFSGIIGCFKSKKYLLGIICIIVWPLAGIMAVVNATKSNSKKYA